MDVKQFKSGFIIDNLLDTFINGSNRKNNAKKLCEWLSHFDTYSKSNFLNSPITYLPQHAVVINLLQRGLPTRLNAKSLELIVNASPLLEWNNTEFAIGVKWSDSIQPNIDSLIYKCLHVIDPRVNRTTGLQNYNQSWERLDSQYEEAFYYNSLPDALGQNGDFIIQLLATQRKITNIIRDKIPLQKLQDRLRKNFEEQRTDFSIEFPYVNENQLSGIVIEVDGSQHNNNEQMYLDTERDKAVSASSWYNTVRIKTSEFNTHIFVNKIKNLVQPALSVDYIQQLQQNYSNSLLVSNQNMEVLAIALSPFAIARLQRVLIEAIAHGKLSMTASEWNIAVFERDVPFAHIAIADFIETVTQLSELSENKFLLPVINVEVFSTKEFINCSLHCTKHVQLFDNFDNNKTYDLLIDLSILEYYFFECH